MGNSKAKLYKISFISFKIIVFFLALWFVYDKVFYNTDLAEIKGGVTDALERNGSVGVLVLVCFLMLVNWGLEALKWQLMLRPATKIEYSKALKAIFSGSTISMFTPNRLGAFIGRILYVDKGHKGQAALTTMFGNYSQLLATLIFGSLAMLLALVNGIDLAGLEHNVIVGAVIVFVAATLVMLYMYYASSSFSKIVRSIPLIKQYANHADILSIYSKSDLHRFLGISLVRYLVFALQFYLLIRLFGIDVTLLEGGIAVASIYLAITFVPASLLGKLGIRESVSIVMLSGYTVYEYHIVAASFTLWVINLAIPALIGGYLLLRVKSQKPIEQ
jgi:hypothetical protein